LRVKQAKEWKESLLVLTLKSLRLLVADFFYWYAVFCKHLEAYASKFWFYVVCTM